MYSQRSHFLGCFRTSIYRVYRIPNVSFSISKKKLRRLNAMPTTSPLSPVEWNPTPNDINLANKLFSINSVCITSQSDCSKLPTWEIPEIAFAGRSNVGKSSLLNVLLEQPGLVKTSKSPGRTQLLNFFSVGGSPGGIPTLSVVDMPGYGYAKAPKAYVEQFHKLVGSYIHCRKNSLLKRVYLLIDSRRGITKVDEDFIEFLESISAIYQIVLTKCDCVSPAELLKVIDTIRSEHSKDKNTMHPLLHVVSARDQIGIKDLRVSILDAAFNGTSLDDN